MTIRLHSKCAGEGEPVVLLHGLFGSGNNLGALARQLQQGFTTCTLDLPNHGRSDWLAAPDLPSMAQALIRWLDAQTMAQVHLVGHSLGGKVAMQVALAQPERVASLVVADIAPVNYQPSHQTVFAALNAVAQAKCESREAAAEVMAQHLKETDVIQFLLTSLRRSQEGVMTWRLDREGLQTAYPDLLAAPVGGHRYDGPTLFIKGGDSNYIQQEHWPDIQSLFSQAEIKVMADCGHWLHAQKPQLFNSTVERFLESHAL